MLTYFTSNLDPVKLYELKHYINFELLRVDLHYTYTCMFQVSVNSNVLHIPSSFLPFHVPVIFTLQQLKISYARCFQQIKSQIFCNLKLMPLKEFKTKSQNNTKLLFKPSSANPTKWSNTLKQFVGCGRQIVCVCLTILRDWRLKG